LLQYKAAITKATQAADTVEEPLKKMYEDNNMFTYDIELTEEYDEISKLEGVDVATVDVVSYTHALPPFLTLPPPVTEQGMTGGLENASLRHIEFVPIAHDAERPRRAQDCFTGCVYVHAEKLLLADWTNGVVEIINKFGIVADTLAMEKPPWGAALVCEDRAVVTCPKARKVFFLETEPHLHVMSYFTTDCECFGVCKIGDNYACTCDPWSKSSSVKIFSQTGEVITTIQADSIGQPYFRCPLHICSDFFNSCMYITDATADCVYGITPQGDILFCYTHKELDYPTGIETDRNNRVYVCGRYSKNIQILSNLGQLLETLWDSEGLQSPSAISFHPHGDHAAVTDLDGNTAMGFWKLSLA